MGAGKYRHLSSSCHGDCKRARIAPSRVVVSISVSGTLAGLYLPRTAPVPHRSCSLSLLKRETAKKSSEVPTQTTEYAEVNKLEWFLLRIYWLRFHLIP